MTADPLALARDLMRCPSVTPAEGGALAFLEATLKAAGFTVHRMTFREPGAEDVENLYARIGTDGAEPRVRRPYRRGAAGRRERLEASALRQRSRRRHAVRPRRRRHEGRHRLHGGRRARSSGRQWRQAERLDLVPDHRRRRRHRRQRHAQAAAMVRRHGRKIRSLPARRAEQCRGAGRHHQDRPARLAQRPSDRHRQAGPRRLSRPRRQSDPRPGQADRGAAVGAARQRQRQFPAVEPGIRLGRCRQQDRQSHSRRSARAVQYPLQRLPHAGVAARRCCSSAPRKPPAARSNSPSSFSRRMPACS